MSSLLRRAVSLCTGDARAAAPEAGVVRLSRIHWLV